mmetsp:Transcript_9830/g.24273  ORF Transcript_9830/g.24273 Transcript_9830/m.24273 type:complete len:215 (+) Transcript_9830:742-1386(+)
MIVIYSNLGGTAKTATLYAVYPSCESDQIFQPVYRGGFAFHGYNSYRIRFIFVNDWRTDVEGLEPSSFLTFTEGDPSMALNQKGEGAASAVNKITGSAPICCMSTNHWELGKGSWTYFDLCALSKRVGAFVHFKHSLPVEVSTIAPDTFRLDRHCPGCAKRLQAYTQAAWKKDTKKADKSQAHLKPGADLRKCHPDLITGHEDSKMATMNALFC